MADYTLATDPFFSLSQEVSAVQEKVADSVFEGYKLQVAQTNDINNRAMQVALSKATALSDLKQAEANNTLQTMLAASRTDAAIGATSAAQQRLAMEQGEINRNLINGINTQNLNTALINTNTSITSLGTQFAGLGLAYGGAVSAYQSANQVSAVNALGSAVSGQRFVNTGNANATSQSSTTNSIG